MSLKQSQESKVWQHLLENGSITDVIAWKAYRIRRLAARINRMRDRDQLMIYTVLKRAKTKDGRYTFAVYQLAKPKKGDTVMWPADWKGK